MKKPAYMVSLVVFLVFALAGADGSQRTHPFQSLGILFSEGAYAESADATSSATQSGDWTAPAAPAATVESVATVEPASTIQPAAAPSSTNPLPVVDGVVQAEDNWMVIKTGSEEAPSYLKLGEVGAVDGYEMSVRDSSDGTHYFAYQPPKDSWIEFVGVWPKNMDAETAAKAYVCLNESKVNGEAVQVEIGGRNGWMLTCHNEENDSDASAPEASAARDQKRYKSCYAFFDAPGGMCVLNVTSKIGDIQSDPEALIQALEPFARMLRLGDEAQSDPARESDGTIAATAPSAAPSTIVSLPVVEGGIQAKDNWIILNNGYGDSSKYIKLGEVQAVAGYSIRARKQFNGSIGFEYRPWDDNQIFLVSVLPSGADAETSARNLASPSEGETVSEVVQIEIGGRKGWSYTKDSIPDSWDTPAPEATAAPDQIGYRDYIVFFDAPGGMSVFLIARSYGGYMETLPDVEVLMKVLEPFASMLKIEDAEPRDLVQENDGAIAATAPTASPSSLEPLLVVDGEVQAEDNWIIGKSGYDDSSEYFKLGEVQPVDGYTISVKDSYIGTRTFAYKPQDDSPIMFVILWDSSIDAETTARSYARSLKDETVGEVVQIEVGGRKGWSYTKDRILDSWDTPAPEAPIASDQIGSRECNVFFDAPGGMSVCLCAYSRHDNIETLPDAETLMKALEPFARMLKLEDEEPRDLAQENDGAIAETAPSAAPSTENLPPVMVGEVQAEDNWIIGKSGLDDSSEYYKLGEVQAVDGYAMSVENSNDGTRNFFYLPQDDSPIMGVSVSTLSSDSETCARTLARAYKDEIVGEAAQIEISGCKGWIFIQEKKHDDRDTSAPKASVASDQMGTRNCCVLFDAPGGMSVMLIARSNSGYMETLPDSEAFIKVLEPFARMLIIGEEAPTLPADPEAEPSATQTLAGDGFTFRDGITWNSTPDEIMESEKANSPVQNEMPFFYITDAIGVENASVASQKADLVYLFSDGRLAMISYHFDNEDYVSASTLNRALSSKYGPSTSSDPSGLLNTMNALSGDLPEGLGEDDKAAVWLLSDGTRVTLCYSGYHAIMITYENVALWDALLSGPPANAGGNTDGL